ncbi:acyltransferase [Pseudoduganella albidiflava]|uniref:Acyltransferase n=1 Tax=Pseudoduganella albidiflava TaxID=321983 RepID=A0A411X212_9BURK|nr:acyltransferase [Pseudoduganella albidiflava]GGY58118.1 acyltransferase [Pseudoduganella albidiflava]
MNMAKPEPGADGAGHVAPPAKDKGFWALNWLRFLLAMYLVLFHTLRFNYAPVADNWLAASLGLGNMATSVFFVLSGFLLTHAYVVKKNGRDINKRNFLIARFSTLYPLHLACLVLAIVAVGGKLFAYGGIPVYVDNSATATRFLEQWEVGVALLMSITLTNAWNPLYLVFNGPSWSLSALGFYYLLFPAVALRIYRMKSLKTALVVLAVLFLLPGLFADLMHRSDALTTGVLHRNPIVRLPLFIAGIVLCVMFTRKTPGSSPAQTFMLGSLVVATTVLATVLRYHDSRLHIIENGLYLPASVAIIWLCADMKPTLHDKVRYWGDRLGAVSLPVFLLHLPLFSVFRKIEQVILVWPSSNGSLSTALATASHVKQSLFFYPVYLILLVTACVLVQEHFVTRVQKAIRNRFSDRSDAKAQAATATREPTTGTY